MISLRTLFTRRTRNKGPVEADYHQPICSAADANAYLLMQIESGGPFMASRLGGIELNCLRHYLFHRHTGKPYHADTAAALLTYAGFFPVSDSTLDDFCKTYLQAVRDADAMAVWLYHDENHVVKEYCPQALLTQPRALEPYYHHNPWSRALTGKRVLVIHPFAESIKEQYENRRSRLFNNPHVLPEFQLRTITAVQSIAGAPTRFASWFEALESMQSAMDAIDYEVCLIGAGAYGLPLAAHAKRAGKTTIHLGGAVQILFGIKGQRWDDHEIISTLYNDAWVRPKPGETPQNFMSVEDGCYW